MRKIILMVLLAAASSNAVAKWLFVGDADDGDDEYALYVNTDNILKKGDKIKLWELQSYKTEQSDDNDEPYLSLKIYAEYDCKKERRKVIFISEHSENMGGGKVVNNINLEAPKWLPVPPDSVAELIWKLVCEN